MTLPAARSILDQISRFSAVAAAEMRSTRRRALAVVYVALVLGGGVALFFVLTGLHAVGSAESPWFALFQPRFFVGDMGALLLPGSMLGLVFLALDVRARDIRSGVVEAVDARPVGNLTMLGGRLAGLVVVSWLPLAALIGAFQGFGLLAATVGLPYGETLEPFSATAFVIMDALPMLVLWCSVVLMLVAVLRSRFSVAVVAVGILGAYWWAAMALPVHLLPAFVGLTAYTAPPSDLVPAFATTESVLQRAGTLLVGAGFLAVAAAAYPRADDRSRRVRVGAGVALIVAGSAVVAGMARDSSREMDARDEWRTVHEACEGARRADVERIEGRVAIRPGEGLAIGLRYRVRASNGALTELVMALNPGMRVGQVAVDGRLVGFEHEAGLLSVELPEAVASGQDLLVSVAATGVPDMDFGYLDGSIDVPRLTQHAGNLLQLGTSPGVFADTYVALMPGTHWLPMPGGATGRENSTVDGRDFYEVDLEVEVPSGWLVAGPGRRLGASGRFRFRPGAPVPSVALLAAPFERRAVEVEGVEFELLVSRKHKRNVAFFADAEPAIRSQIADFLEEAASVGLGYPYTGMSLVEIPAKLRTFGGGWRMESTQALPGLLLLREYGFTSSRFDFLFLRAGRRETGHLAGAKVAALRRYFDNDIAGGGLYQAVVRNLLSFQTGAVGEGAIAVDAMLRELTLRLLTPSRSGYFSAHALGSNRQLPPLLQQVIEGVRGGGRGEAAATIQRAVTRRQAVWEEALRRPLVALDKPDGNVRLALDLLWLKAPAVAQAVLDGLGREVAGRLLSELRRRYGGRSFTAAEFEEVAANEGVELEAVVGDWLTSKAMPGYVVSPGRVDRMVPGGDGRARYNSRVHVRNGETTPGMVRLAAVVEASDGGWESVFRTGRPVRVGGRASVELGLVTVRPPQELWVQPLLSLNRRDLLVRLPRVDEARMSKEPPVVGWRSSRWKPAPEPGIVVDDLDAGFAPGYGDEGDRVAHWSSGGSWTGADVDQGLPVYSSTLAGARAEWARQELPLAFGRYRRTTARVESDRAEALFAASLPHGGRWLLAYHLPVGGRSVGATGATYRFVVEDGSVSATARFDAHGARLGWNDIGAFDLSSGEVEVSVSRVESRTVVFADAIRWSLTEE